MSATGKVDLKPIRKTEMWRPEGDKIVIIDDNATYIHVLNVTASLVWKLSDGKHTIRDVVKALTDEYGVSEEEAWNDVSELLQGLAEKKLISLE